MTDKCGSGAGRQWTVKVGAQVEKISTDIEMASWLDVGSKVEEGREGWEVKSERVQASSGSVATSPGGQNGNSTGPFHNRIDSAHNLSLLLVTADRRPRRGRFES